MSTMTRVLHEDDVLLVVSKPPGFTSLPSDKDNGRSVLAQLERWLGSRGEEEGFFGRLLPLHRLDKDTSGVLLFSKQKWAVPEISEQFRYISRLHAIC